MTALIDPSPRTVIDELLAEQQKLTAVERFSQRHERGDLPAQERYYRDLVPSSAPKQGQQYAFAVDLDACTGCKACVAGCHSLNGLEEHEMWRSVGSIHGGTSDQPYQQTVTTACHHCVEPGCLEGCPVMAYDKDEDTGVVRHLDDQCIGCQYCVLKCPYDVPKYSKRLGIVRKCDMCIDRLAVGEAPACVQACPTHAIRIELVDKAEVSAAAAPGSRMLPGAFDSSYTKPTTRYRSTRGVPENCEAADHSELRLDHAHWPLIGMLLLTQTAVGIAALLAAGVCFGGNKPVFGQILSTGCWLILQLGLAVSVLHLGRPLGAWRFFLGLRTSWMSREILAFSVFAAVSTAAVAAAWIPVFRELLPIAALFTTGVGLFSVFTSAMIYIDTKRPFWNAHLTGGKFFGATFLLGSTASAVLLSSVNVFLGGLEGPAVFAALVATIVRTALFIWETKSYRNLLEDPKDPASSSARTIATLLPWLPRARNVLFAISSFAGVLAMAGGSWSAAVFALIAAIGTFASQVLERYSFFTAGSSPRMPGGVSA